MWHRILMLQAFNLIEGSEKPANQIWPSDYTDEHGGIRSTDSTCMVATMFFSLFFSLENDQLTWSLATRYKHILVLLTLF